MPARHDAPSDDLVEGDRLLDRYVIIDRVDAGGMATIYRAHDERLDRLVCVKLLREALTENDEATEHLEYEAQYKHFLEEAKALSRLSHPNTLRIYDFGYLEGTRRPFHVCEFLDAGSLDHRVRRHGVLDEAETLAILEALAGALEEAHGHRIIHRDIKPSNILFGRVGQQLIPKLADFGIARVMRARRASIPDDTGSHQLIALFSPRWAAPEQIAGASVGPYTDVYALALVVAFMLTGVPVFDGKNLRASYAERIMGDSYVNARVRQLGLPPRTVAPLLRALTARPERRTPTPTALLDDLRAVLSDGAKSASRAAPPREENTLSISVEEVVGPERRTYELPRQELAMEGRPVQLVDVADRVDVGLASPAGMDARVRVTLLWDRQGIRLNVKGLNCFVARPGASPAAAIVTKEDGSAELVSSARERLGALSWSFGARQQGGTLFRVDGREVLVPYTRATHAVALDLGAHVVIVCMATS